MDWRPPLSFIRQLSGQIPRNSSHSIGRGSAGARCAGSVVIGSAVHVPFILARHKDKSPDLRPILADTFRETQAISRIAINRPYFGTRRSPKRLIMRPTSAPIIAPPESGRQENVAIKASVADAARKDAAPSVTARDTDEPIFV